MSWKTVSFGSICGLTNGKAFKASDWRSTGVPIIRIQNLNDPDKPFNYWAGSLESQVPIKQGDLLFAWSGTPGTSFGAHIWRGGDAILNQHIFRCDLDLSSALPEWARFSVNTCLEHLISRAHGGVGLKHVTKVTVEELRIPLPSLVEQRRLTKILAKAEALCTQRRAALAQLDDLTQAIFLEMFGDPVALLENWPNERLGTHLDFLTSGSRGWAAHYASSGALFLRIQNVRRDELVLDDIAYVKPPDTKEAERTRVQAGDVLLSITADLGRTAVIPAGIGTAFINQHLSILRTTALVPRFLSAYLASPAGQKQIAGRNRQGVKAGLNFDDIRSLVIPVPPNQLQEVFAQRVAAVEKLKATHRTSLAELDALFASLQHRAFRGEL